MALETLTQSPPAPPMTDIVDRDTAAVRIHVKASTLAYWAHTGKFRNELPYAVVGKKAYYRIADLDAWLASRFPAEADREQR